MTPVSPQKPRVSVPRSLYVHIPWCTRKCPYCDFNSHENFDPSLEGPYVDALLQDLRLQLEALPSLPLTSLFIGGGTPSLFSPSAIGRLLDGIGNVMALPQDVEITLECNPGSAEVSRFEGYRAAGVNRLSLGIQSFNDDALRRLGRIHDAAQGRRAAESAQRYFPRVNVDLMHGLPDQTLRDAAADLETGIELTRGHISWYQLTIEPNTAFYSQRPRLPCDDALADIQERGEDILNNAGFQQYEVSAWSQPGQASQHNLNYWTFGDYLGIGAGAHGKITLAEGIIARTRRSRLPRDYLQSIEKAQSPITSIIEASDITAEFLLNALRLKSGFPITVLEERTGKCRAALEPTWQQLTDQGLLCANGDQLGTTALGYRFLNDVIAAFLND